MRTRDAALYDPTTRTTRWIVGETGPERVDVYRPYELGERADGTFGPDPRMPLRDTVWYHPPSTPVACGWAVDEGDGIYRTSAEAATELRRRLGRQAIALRARIAGCGYRLADFGFANDEG